MFLINKIVLEEKFDIKLRKIKWILIDDDYFYAVEKYFNNGTQLDKKWVKKRT